MNPTGALIGLLATAGILLIITGMQYVPLQPKPPTPRRTISAPINWTIVTAGTSAGVLVAVVSGWWALAVLAAAGSALMPLMLGERAAQVRERVRLAALASWVEAVRDLLSAASGIEEAVARSADALPPGSPVRTEVTRLRACTESLGLREGLRRFGDEIADPIGDYVTASLLVASERASAAVHGQLSEAASNARESVAVRERVEASRARMWTSASTIAAISVLMVGFIIGTQPTYLTWYSKPVGQIVLVACGGVELVGMWWMARMARPPKGHRIVLFDQPENSQHATNQIGIVG